MHTGAFHWVPKSLVEQPSVDLRCELRDVERLMVLVWTRKDGFLLF